LPQSDIPVRKAPSHSAPCRQLIDVGSYRTRRTNSTATVRGLLATAYWFTMFGKRDRIQQLTPDARDLFRSAP